MENLTSKCDSCGYSMVFNPDNGMLSCSHCGSSKVINSEVVSNKRVYDANSSVARNVNTTNVLECDGCGAKTNLTEQSVSGVCPYCGSTNLHKFTQTLDFTPDGIVPFAISKQKAREHYKEWIKTRKFVPNALKSSAKINKMEGHYFPCWNYDFNVNTTYSGVGVERHTRTVRRSGPNGNMITDRETYYTRHPFSGKRFDEFTNETTMASNHITNDELDQLGRYGVNDSLKVYNTAYLLGFLSSEYSLGVHDALKNAKLSAEKVIESRAKETHGYDSYSSFNMENTYSNIMWQYIYLPVWICNFKFKKKEFRFLVNGFTGHVIGKVPRSGWKIFGLVLGILAGVFAIGAAIYFFSQGGTI